MQFPFPTTPAKCQPPKTCIIIPNSVPNTYPPLWDKTSLWEASSPSPYPIISYIPLPPPPYIPPLYRACLLSSFHFFRSIIVPKTAGIALGLVPLLLLLLLLNIISFLAKNVFSLRNWKFLGDGMFERCFIFVSLYSAEDESVWILVYDFELNEIFLLGELVI